MDITTYADRLREEVGAATALGGADVVAAADRLLLALDPAIRLVLLEAVSDATAEISAEIPEGGVDVRLRGRDLKFVVETVGPDAVPAPSSTDPGSESDEGDQVRITLRLPDTLKSRAEEQAAERGQSLNSWLMDAVRSAATGPPQLPGRPGRRMAGWA